MVQPTCAVPTGVIVFGNQSGVEYSIGGVFQTNPMFGGLSPNNHNLSVRSTSDNTCITNGPFITINTAPTLPANPTSLNIQPTCALPTGMITIATQAGVEYSINNGVSYQPSNVFNNLSPANYSLSVRRTSDKTCVNGSSVTAQIKPVSTLPMAPTASAILQPTCVVQTGTIIVAFQTGVQYNTGAGYQSLPTFTNLAPASYTLSVRNTADTTCITTGSTIIINTAPTPPSAPTVGSVVQPTCAVPSGTIVFDNQTGVQYSIGSGFQNSATFSNLSPGTYTLFVRSINDNTCVTTGGTVTINAVPTPPSVPALGSIVQPTCALPSGKIVFLSQSGIQYSVGAAYQNSETFAGLKSGGYNLRVRSISDTTCVTNGASLIVHTVSNTPFLPTTNSVENPSCIEQKGSINITVQTGVEYSIGSGFQKSPTFSALSPGSYTLSVRNIADTTCVNTNPSAVTVLPIPSPPALPTTSGVVQPSCTLPWGTVVFSVQLGVQYSIGSGFQVSPVFLGVAPGSYTLYVRNNSDTTCLTSGTTVVIDSIPTPPSIPVLDSVIQPTCALPLGTITFANQMGVEYGLGTFFQNSEIFAGLLPGSYTLTARRVSDITCITTGANVIVNSVPDLPSTPIVGSVVHPTCAVPTGTISIATQTGVQYSIGSGFQTSPNFSSLQPGDYTLSVRKIADTTCMNNSVSSVTLLSVPFAPGIPSVSGLVQPTCALPSGAIIFTAQSGVQYSIGSGFQVSPVFLGVAPGSYTLRVRSSLDTTCATSGSIVVVDTIPTPPMVPSLLSVMQPTCAVPLGTVSFTSQSGVQYSVGNAFQNSETFASLVPGSYTLRVRSVSDMSCITTGASVTVNPVLSLPDAPTLGSILQPTCALPTGSIVINTQTGVQYSIGSGFQTSPLFSGISSGGYSLSVRNQLDTTCITTGTFATVNAVPALPLAPTASEITQPSCANPTGAITIATQSGVQYSIGSGFQSSSVFPNLSPGTYTLTVRKVSDITCTSNSLVPDTILVAPPLPSIPNISSIVHPTCLLPGGTINLTTQTGVQYSVGFAYQTSPTFTGLATGSYQISVRSISDSTCITAGSLPALLDSVTGAPPVPKVVSVVQPTCALHTGSIVVSTLSGVEYSIGAGFQSSPIFNGIAPGTYTISVRFDSLSSCISIGTPAVTINAVPSTPAAPIISQVVQPTCAVTSGTVMLSSQPGIEFNIGSGYQTSTVFGGLAPGNYNIISRNVADSTCENTIGVSTVIDNIPIAPLQPTANIIHPTCALPSGTIIFNTQTGVEYSIGGAFQTSPVFAALLPGVYTLTVRQTSDTTCLSTALSPVTINLAPKAPIVPVFTLVQPTCAVPSGTIVFVSPTNVQYSLGTGYQSSATFANLAPGKYIQSVRNILDSTCVTVGDSITIDTLTAEPTTPLLRSVVQPNCTFPTGTILFEAQSAVHYSIGDAFQNPLIFTGLVPGSYTLSVRSIEDTTCVTKGSTLTINAAPSLPIAPTIDSLVQPTCALNSGTIVAYSQSGVEYSIGSGFQSSNEFSGLAPGVYTLRAWKKDDNTCVITGSSVTINAVSLPPSTPSVDSLVQPTCVTPSGTIKFKAQVGVTYSLGGGYQVSPIFANLLPGNYFLSVRSTNDTTCVTMGATVTINAIPIPTANPNLASVVQPTCAVQSGTINFLPQAGVTYSIGNTFQSSFMFTGLMPGNYTLFVRSNTDSTCVTTGATVTINTVPSVPIAPVVVSLVHPTCGLPSGSVVLSMQSGVEYSIGKGFQTSPKFVGLSANNYTLSARNTFDHTCVATGSSVTINSLPPSPSVPTVDSLVQPTCAVPKGKIKFKPQVGATYSLGIGFQYSASFEGVAPGSYILRVRSISDTTCVTIGSTETIDAVPTNPVTPNLDSVVQPICAVPSGSISFVAQSGVLYSVGGAYQTSTIFNELAPGMYNLQVRKVADSTCIAKGTSVEIDKIPSLPKTPTVGNVVQPTCASPSGNISFTAQTNVQYSLGAGYQSSPTFVGLFPGNYTLSVRNVSDSTCINTSGNAVTIDTVPSFPSIPLLDSLVQATCAVPTGSIVFLTQSAVEYSLGSGYQGSVQFAGLAAGNYTLSVRKMSDYTCESSGASVTIHSAPNLPFAPTIDSLIQPTCAWPLGKIILESQADVQYSLGATFQDSSSFNDLVPDNYIMRVRSVIDTTCMTYGGLAVINAVSTLPNIPITSNVVQPTCALPTGAIEFDAQPGVLYSVGSGYQVSTMFAGLLPANYTLSVRNISDSTCVTNGADVTIDDIPSLPSIPALDNVVQPTCSVPTGVITIASQTDVSYSIGFDYQSSSVFAGLVPGSYVIRVRNVLDTTCVVTGFSQTIDTIPNLPATPSIASVVQPTCSLPSGSITFTSQTGVEYSIGFGYQASPVFTALPSGNYSPSLRNIADNTCIANATSVQTINTVPAVPTLLLASQTEAPNCLVGTGTIKVSTPTGSNFEYNIDGGKYQSFATFSSVAPGSHSLLVRLKDDTTCVIASSTVVKVDKAFDTPTAPTLIVTQPTCTLPTGSVEVSSSKEGLSFSINGVNYANTSGIFDGLSIGSYIVTAKNADGCVSPSSSFDVNPPPALPIQPLVSVIQPVCGTPTATLTVISPVSGLSFSFDNGINYQASNTKTGVLGNATYQVLVKDSSSKCVSQITSAVVNAVPNCPPMLKDTIITVQEDNSVTVCVKIADIGLGQTYTVASCGNPSNGFTNTPSVNGNHLCLTYTPNKDFNGVDNLCISVCDNGVPSLCDTTRISVVVTPVNDSPVVENEVLVIEEDSTFSGNVLNVNDLDPDGTNLLVNVNPIFVPTHGTFDIKSDGSFTYRPAPNYHGVDMAVVLVCDQGIPLPPLCKNDTIFITVSPVNDSANVLDKSISIPQDMPYTGSLLTSDDYDPDGTTLVVDPNPIKLPKHGIIVINSDSSGVYTYTPNLGYLGPDTVIVWVCDHGFPLPAICMPETLFINVGPVNHVPIIVNNQSVIELLEDSKAISQCFQINDVDGSNGIYTVADTGSVKHGKISITLTNKQLCVNYIPNLNFNGRDTLNISLLDNGLPVLPFTANIYFNVKPVYDNREKVIQEDIADTIGMAYDLAGYFPKYSISVLSAPLVLPKNGTISVIDSSTYLYTPNINFNGIDTLVVSVFKKDPDLALFPIYPVNDTIFIFVSPVNDKPVIKNEYHEILQNSSVSGNLFNGDIDPDGTKLDLNLTPVVSPNNGTILVNSDGQYTYTPKENYFGEDMIVFSICDNGLPLPVACAFDTIFIKVLLPKIHIPEGFSPNGDGVNDYFVIKGIEAHPNNNLVIFNRWGNKVHEVNPYKNMWAGKSDVGLRVDSEELPIGSYFYVLDLGDDFDPPRIRKGTVYINR